MEFMRIKNLNNEERLKLAKISESELKKLDYYGKMSNTRLDIKIHSSEGKAKKYTLHLSTDCNMIFFEANTTDWDIATAAHKVFKKIANEIKKKFKIIA